MPLMLAFLVLLAISAAPSLAAIIQGRVVAIADGDTLTVLDATKTQHKIRLAGIDAPEKKQPFGTRSRQHLSDKVFGKDVIVETSKLDRYGRTIGKVRVGDIDANLAQIEAGLAWHYKAYAKEQSAEDRAQYADAENSAKAARRGLWADENPVPPWEWRHRGQRP